MPEITAASASRDVKTRFLVLSDTHGLDADSLPDSIKRQYADVVIHCGDLTAQSEIEDYKASIRFLQALDAPLKLVIAGNHDFTMDIPVFQRKMAEAQPPLDPRLVEKTFGKFGEARQLFNETDITFLDEGTHSFRLQNGALLNVHASPYTPSLGDWGFQYHLIRVMSSLSTTHMMPLVTTLTLCLHTDHQRASWILALVSWQVPHISLRL